MRSLKKKMSDLVRCFPFFGGKLFLPTVQGIGFQLKTEKVIEYDSFSFHALVESCLFKNHFPTLQLSAPLRLFLRMNDGIHGFICRKNNTFMF